MGSKRTAAAMIQHLEGSLKRGVDLLSVLGRLGNSDPGPNSDFLHLLEALVCCTMSLHDVLV